MSWSEEWPNNLYDPTACRLLVVRMLWDAVIDYVRCFDKRHHEAREFLFSSGGYYLLECLQMSPTAALKAIYQRREDFKHKLLLAYIDPMHENELERWWVNWYGNGLWERVNKS